MVDKKITVLGDAADASLSPEEEHKIEVKIDKMLAVTSASDVQTPVASSDTMTQARQEKVQPAKMPLQTFAPVTKTAPPVPKPSNAPKRTHILITEHGSADESLAKTSHEVNVRKTKKTERVTGPDAEKELINKAEALEPGAPELSDTDLIEQLAAAAVEDLKHHPQTKSEPAADNDTAAASDAAEVQQPQAEPLAGAPAPKKYRPPDGPLPFKRAQPLVSEAAAFGPLELEPSELDGDNVAASPAEHPFSARKQLPRTAAHPKKRGLKKFAVLMVLILIVGIAALPTTRNRVADMLHHQASQPALQASNGQVSPASSQQAFVNQDVYIVKQNGKYNVYKSAADGTNKQLLLAGSGYETSKLALVTSNAGDYAALTSTRDNQKDSSGYLLQTLTLINVKSGSSLSLDHGQQINIVGWLNNRLIYSVSTTTPAASSKAVLKSYNPLTKQNLELDRASSFNAVMAARGLIYYATYNSQANNPSRLMRSNADGTDKRVLLNHAVWNLFRTDYNDLSLATTNAWYDLKLDTAHVTTTVNAYKGQSIQYVDSPDGKYSARAATQGTTGLIMLYNLATQTESVVTQQPGLGYPIHWLNNDTLVYRMSTTEETADYSVGRQAGAVSKITDVIDARGVSF